MLKPFSVPPSAVSLSTISEGNSVAGQSFVLYCLVTTPNSLSALPEITWTNPNGVEVYGQVNTTFVGNTVIVTSMITFDPLLTSQSGIYMCQLSLSSPSLQQPLNVSSLVAISVQSKFGN